MSLKNTDFDIVVVGSGLSSLSFIDSYLEKNKKINVISPNFKLSNTKGEYSNSHIDHYSYKPMFFLFPNVKALEVSPIRRSKAINII